MYAMTLYICLGLLAVMFAMQKLAFNYAMKQPKPGRIMGSGTIEASILGLLGILMAFTFSGAHTRFEARRQLMVQETNAIGTAFLRLDLLTPEAKAETQKLFLEYIDNRIHFYDRLINPEAVINELKTTEKLQNEIWEFVINSTKESKETTSRILLIPALNEMIDIVTTRSVAAQSHTSVLIFLVLIAIMVICSVLSGLSMSKTGIFSTLYALIFALVTVITLYMILDLEYPRFGLIRLDYAHQALIDLKNSMMQRMVIPHS
jgi:hypothetical protein